MGAALVTIQPGDGFSVTADDMSAIDVYQDEDTFQVTANDRWRGNWKEFHVDITLSLIHISRPCCQFCAPPGPAAATPEG